MIGKALLKSLLKQAGKRWALDKVKKYVEEDNELDDAVRELRLENHEIKMRLERLEKSE